MKKFLSLFVLMLVGASAFAQWVKPTLKDYGIQNPKSSGFLVQGDLYTPGAYGYLFNEETGGFFVGANDWGTRASVCDTLGHEVFFEDMDGDVINWSIVSYVLEGNAKNSFRRTFADNPTNIWVDNNDGANALTWSISDPWHAEKFTIGNHAAIFNNMTLGAYTDKCPVGDTRLYMANKATTKNFGNTWYFTNSEEYEKYTTAVKAIAKDYYAKAEIYNQAMELGNTIEEARAKNPSLNLSAEEAVYNNTSSTLTQLRAAIESLKAKLQRPTVFYKVDPTKELTLSESSLDGVTAVITDRDGKKTWGVFTGSDGQDVNANCTSVSAWSSKSEYCYVKFYHVAGQADNVYYVKFVNTAGNWYNPRGTWHGNQGCMNVTGNGTGIFVGGNSAHTHGQDIENGALWKVTKTTDGYSLCNVAKGVYAVPGVGVVSGQENGYVSLYSGFTTYNPEEEGEYTHYIANNTVDGADLWTIERPNGGNGPLLNGTSFEYWGGDASPRENASFNYYQNIYDLPAGKYILSAEMYNSSNGEEGNHAPNGNAGLYIKCGETEQFVGVTEDGTTLKKYSTAEIVVKEGDVVTVGIKSKGYMSARWFVADNFELRKADNPTGISNTATDDIKIMTIKTIENGQVVIMRDGKKYNVLGQKM